MSVYAQWSCCGPARCDDSLKHSFTDDSMRMGNIHEACMELDSNQLLHRATIQKRCNRIFVYTRVEGKQGADRGCMRWGEKRQ
eukprot:358996-Chlamydomonas_euryale.AAC.5